MTTTFRSLSARVRPDFPALRRTFAGREAAYFDGPGGTQVPRGVAEAVSDYLLSHNANDGWAYATSRETDALLVDAHRKAAAFVNAATPGEIVFGANMTTLNFAIARAFGRSLDPGDEIVVTDLDHHANIDPWVALERDFGATIVRVPLLDDRPQLDFAAYERLLGPRTRLVALGLSSNAFGTVNPVADYARLAHERGASVFVDAVHAAAHQSLDVRALGADMLAFSAYKLYGPHVGVLYCRDELLERLDVPRVRPQKPIGSKRAESGTLNHEGIVGTVAALDFLAGITPATDLSLRERFVATMQTVAAEEEPVFESLARGLRELPNVTVYEPPESVPRHPTIAFAVTGAHAQTVAALLSDEYGIFVSHGDFYAATAVAKVAPETLARGGVLRAGVGIYTTPDDVRRLLEAVSGLQR